MATLKMLAIDLGASSGRGMVGKFDGKKISLEEIHRFPNGPVNLNGSLYWDILRTFGEIKSAIHNCAMSDNKDIKSMAIDTWGVDYGLLDKDGKLLENPYCYRDSRTAGGIMEELFKIIPKKDLYKITGTQFLNFNTIYQLYSLVKYRPRALSEAKDMLFIPDLLKYFLTGVKQTEYTVASTSQMLDAEKRDWAYDIIEKLGIPKHILGKIVEPGTVCGELLPQISEEIGGISPKVINTASHDTAAAVVAVPSQKEDFVYISSGTWSLMGRELSEPSTGELSYKYDITNEGGAERKIRFLKNIMGLWIEQESRRQWQRQGEDVSFNDLSDAAVAAEPLKCLINPDDIMFQAPGNMPRRIQEYCERTGQYVPQTKGEIVRCIFDSLALCYRRTVESLDDITGKKAPYINIVGGGTKEEPLCRFTADACGRPVYTGPVEATALGNIAVQAIASGEIANVREAREVIANSFEIKYFEPRNTSMWDEGYAKFLKLLEK